MELSLLASRVNQSMALQRGGNRPAPAFNTGFGQRANTTSSVFYKRKPQSRGTLFLVGVLDVLHRSVGYFTRGLGFGIHTELLRYLPYLFHLRKGLTFWARLQFAILQFLGLYFGN